ncbi:MAG: glycosyltransferase, partial [Cyanobacteria bacterium]|nr:glycosyltransferase [Cyanobacteriota bacterium]
MTASPETSSVDTHTSKPPHILLMNNFFAPDGGAELSTLANYHLLKEKNMNVSIFATDRKPYFLSDEELKPFTPYFPRYIDYDKTSGLVGKLQQVQRIFYNHECEKKLNQFLEKNRPDLVHCNNIHYHLTPSILKACQDHQIPVIMTVRDARLMCPSGTLMIGAEKYCEQELCVTGSALNCLTHKCYEKSFSKSAVVTAEFMARDFHHLYDSITKFVFPSEAMLELAARSGIPRNKLVKINNFAEDKIVNLVPSFQGGNYF